ncbi:PREDICTED: neuropeptide-like 1 [Dufourea novaeangliae]|uniref:neuropeptide-like 1 n=1 Tax=Dufourea novaeangliae TaxID=178035 RepID=UPI00076745F2|nr:PREDICTED: neuropeptide-like 1 [Dufourea novaeangliae]
MSLTRSYLVIILLYVAIVNHIHLPLVRCQDEESSQCIPKRAFLTLLRLPEVNSYLAAYSRTARVIQNTEDRSGMAHLKALTEDGDDDTEICIPAGIYLELFKDPAMRGHLSVIGRTQKFPDISGRLLEDSEEIDTRDLLPVSQKKSIAMLAKNDDLPISLQDRIDENQDDEEKRIDVSSDQSDRNVPEIPHDYLLPGEALDLEALAREYPMEKRNVGTLARDFALPPGRRNIASLVRDYELQTKGNNVGDHMLPFTGKRNVASLARTFTLPQNGKRNVASIARDYGLPYGKRYVGSLARTGDIPMREQGKRSVAILAKNMAWPASLKRGSSVPGTVILRALARHGRSLASESNARNNYEGGIFGDEKLNDSQAIDGFYERIDSTNRRPQRQISFTDEYPLPVMQNTNGFDYEEMMEALSGQYPNAEKRFMETGSMPEVQQKVERSGYSETFQASKRHIGALARLGWLPSLRAVRFSRSPRYFVGRENPSDGSSSNYSSNSSTRSLKPNIKPGAPYVQALHGDCRHGFKRFLLLPTTDKFLRQKFPNSI